jgi:hypothetical protein
MPKKNPAALLEIHPHPPASIPPLNASESETANPVQSQLGPLRLGRGNQAYQFDTLPIRVGGVEELRPGDLVFYQATFTQGSGSKAQLHDMVHVEVFVGGQSGEVGCRWSLCPIEGFGHPPNKVWRKC